MKDTLLVHQEINKKIFEARGIYVMIDSDLAALYGVTTKALNQAVARNLGRFPRDFMFRLTQREFLGLRSQFVTSKRGGRQYTPFVFTEHGILMLSSVLRSERAVKVNIQIMRTFVLLRESLGEYKQLKKKIEEMGNKYDGQFQIIFRTMQELVSYKDEEQTTKIGFPISD